MKHVPSHPKLNVSGRLDHISILLLGLTGGTKGGDGSMMKLLLLLVN